MSILISGGLREYQEKKAAEEAEVREHELVFGTVRLNSHAEMALVANSSYLMFWLFCAR